MNKPSKITFEEFKEFFPKVDLPVTVSDEVKYEFSKRNKPFSLGAVHEFIFPLETEEVDDVTEFLPCFTFETEAEFSAMVYWKGGLLKHEYFLVTFDKDGAPINKKVIAGMRIENNQVIQSVATIDEDFIIHIIVGSKQNPNAIYDPSASQAMNMEILGDGDIIFSLNED